MGVGQKENPLGSQFLRNPFPLKFYQTGFFSGTHFLGGHVFDAQPCTDRFFYRLFSSFLVELIGFGLGLRAVGLMFDNGHAGIGITLLLLFSSICLLFLCFSVSFFIFFLLGFPGIFSFLFFLFFYNYFILFLFCSLFSFYFFLFAVLVGLFPWFFLLGFFLSSFLFSFTSSHGVLFALFLFLLIFFSCMMMLWFSFFLCVAFLFSRKPCILCLP